MESVVTRHLQQLAKRCRESGMNLTPQRIAVYRALLETKDHPTPEMLFNRVREEMPSLSLATIYKTLEALERLDLVQEVSVGGERRRYDANMDAHHHLVCSRCGRIVDFYDEELSRLPRRKLGGFTPRSISVKITGFCSPCTALERG